MSAFLVFLPIVSLAACGSASSKAVTDAGCECGQDEICLVDRCVPASCENLAIDGSETDVDCGGNCAPCTEGQLCDSAGDCASRFCSVGVCRDCTAEEDCSSLAGTTCIAGVCALPGGLGNACVTNENCETGHCSDGVCCNEACEGTCRTCLAADSDQEIDGVCDDVSAGSDPDNECELSGDSCGTTGVCDGAGACALASTSTTCAPASCEEDFVNIWAKVTLASTCDGLGACQTGAVVSCPGGYRCNADLTACRTTCSIDDHCFTEYYYCSGTSCQPL